jgi:hypothetical protein
MTATLPGADSKSGENEWGPIGQHEYFCGKVGEECVPAGEGDVAAVKLIAKKRFKQLTGKIYTVISCAQGHVWYARLEEKDVVVHFVHAGDNYIPEYSAKNQAFIEGYHSVDAKGNVAADHKVSSPKKE